MAITFHPFAGPRPFNYRDWSALQESLGEGHMPVGWVNDERAPHDRAFIDACDKYSLVSMYDAEGDEIEVVMEGEQPIGVLDNANIEAGDLDRYQTLEQTEIREGREEAARESYYDALREERELMRQGVV